MKGEITFKILEVVSDLGSTALDVFSVLVTSGYGESYGRMRNRLLKIQYKKQTKNLNKEHRYNLKRNYDKLIYKLKKDGLIREGKDNDNLHLTLLGKKALNNFNNKNLNRLPGIYYSKQNSDKVIIVAFDIPEKEARKRWWLRSVLKNMDFRMIQKSFWVGKVKIPKDFIDDLYDQKLIDFVEIFEINKKGSLRQLD